MNIGENKDLFVQKNSPDGGFLQSQFWKKFQERIGRKTYVVEDENFYANIVQHQLPIVGKYLYAPRGPVISFENEGFPIKSQPLIFNDQNTDEFKIHFSELIKLARENNAGWIRIEPATEKLLEFIKENVSEKIVKAPHDMQPKEIFVVDILKSESQLLAEMKSKTRYNIGIANKKGVVVETSSEIKNFEKVYVDDFLRLTKEMAVRQGIVTHPEDYYKKMIEEFPDGMLRLYVAKYDGIIIATNLVLFYGKFATYLHGASSNIHRNVMAPFLLQWNAMLDAKRQGCEKYDFGGVQTPGVKHENHSDLSGVTNFKLGFSPKTESIVFPGSFDIIINPRRYAAYRGLQRAKAMLHKIRI